MSKYLTACVALAVIVMALTGCGGSKSPPAASVAATPAPQCDKPAATKLAAGADVADYMSENKLASPQGLLKYLCTDLDGDGNKDLVLTIYDGSNHAPQTFFAFRAGAGDWVDISSPDRVHFGYTGITARTGRSELWSYYPRTLPGDHSSCPTGGVAWTRWQYAPSLKRLDDTAQRLTWRKNGEGCSTTKFIPTSSADDDRVVGWNASGIPSRIGSVNNLDDALAAGDSVWLEDAFGKPDSTLASGQFCNLEWKVVNVSAALNFAGGAGDPCEEGSLSTVSLGEGWRTRDKGLAVGDSLARLKRLYPDAQKTRAPRISGKVWSLSSLVSDPMGGTTHAWVNARVKNDRVTAIVVDSPAGAD